MDTFFNNPNADMKAITILSPHNHYPFASQSLSFRHVKT